MPMEASEIERLIRQALPEAEVEIKDLAGDNNHYAATIVAPEFAGLSRVKQHKLVYAALQGKMDGPAGELHALALTTRAPAG